MIRASRGEVGPAVSAGAQPEREVRPALGRRGRLLVLGVWVGLGLLESAKGWVNARLNGAAVGPADVLVGNLPWWLMWAALTPAAIFLARRLRLDRRRAISIPSHLVLSVLFALLHLLVVGTLFYYTNSRGSIFPIAGRLQVVTPAVQLRLFFGLYFVVNVLTYWAIVGSYLAFEFYRRYRQGELRAARLEAAMHEARLNALQAELNPHFLFNTLNAISGLVRRHENRDAVRVLARLGDLLRTTLEREGEQEVPLEKELELLRIYLEIVQVRYHDRLTVEMAIESKAMAGLVPTLILQPLVENAVRYGVARRAGPGRIVVEARRVDGNLELAVTNTGAMNLAPSGRPSRIEERTAANGTGIGLTNTRERLVQLYGERGRLSFVRLPDGGARVVVGLPFQVQRDLQEGDSGRQVPGERARVAL